MNVKFHSNIGGGGGNQRRCDLGGVLPGRGYQGGWGAGNVLCLGLGGGYTVSTHADFHPPGEIPSARGMPFTVFTSNKKEDT